MPNKPPLHPRPVYTLLQTLFGIDKAKDFAIKFQIPPTTWAGAQKGKASISEKSEALLIAALNTDFQGPAPFVETDLDLSKDEFVAKVRVSSKYQRQLDELPGLKEHHRQSSRLDRLEGHFIGMYICSDPKATGKLAIRVDAFHITRTVTGIDAAAIFQGSYLDDTRAPRGTVKLVDETLEISLDYEPGRDPKATYLAVVPQADPAHAFLALSLDMIAAPKDKIAASRIIVSSPITFLRVKMPADGGYHGESTRIFKAVNKTLRDHCRYNKPRWLIEIDPAISNVNVRNMIEAWEAHINI